MTSLQIQQLVYCRLQREYSPHRRTGYQTVYVSPSLAPVAKEIERKIESYTVSRQDPDAIRIQYFRVSDGRFVVARSQTVTHFEIVDTSREGILMAHAVVINRNEFCRVGCNPFAILDGSDVFVRDPEDLHQRYVVQRPPDTITINVPPRWPIKFGLC
ncbi:MAG: hypothetical protein AAFP69_02280, partial [Planctomycetota bacterium]